MAHRLRVGALSVMLLLPSIAAAQSAAVDNPIQMETRRQRLIVRPEPPVGAAVRDAERAASETSAAELAREASEPQRRAPQLDYDVTSAIQGRSLPRANLRPGH